MATTFFSRHRSRMAEKSAAVQPAQSSGWMPAAANSQGRLSARARAERELSTSTPGITTAPTPASGRASSSPFRFWSKASSL